MASPAKHAMKNDVNPARRAAASAGTTWNASVCASSAMSGATSTPSPPATTHASTVFSDREAARGQAGEHRGDLVLRRRPRRQAERRPPVERRQQRRDEDHDPREQEPVLRHDAVEDRRRCRKGGPTGADFRLLPKIRIIAGLEDEQEPERRGQLGERRRVPERAEDRQLDEDAEHGHADEREHEGRHRREVEVEVAGPERPEEVGGEHRDRAGRRC